MFTPLNPTLAGKIDIFTRLAMDNLEICGPNSVGYQAALVLLGAAIDQWYRGRIVIKPLTQLQQQALTQYQMRKAS